jgi:hypothetical protein
MRESTYPTKHAGAAMAKKLKTFNVNLSVTLDVMTDVRAETMEDALAEARTLRPGDLLALSGVELNDSGIEVLGVFG